METLLRYFDKKFWISNSSLSLILWDSLKFKENKMLITYINWVLEKIKLEE